MYGANVFMETIEKRLPCSRWLAEVLLVATACILIAVASRWMFLGFAICAAYLLLVLHNLLRERTVFNSVYAVPEAAGLKEDTQNRLRVPAPCLHPRLSLNLEGPFVSRFPQLNLGVLPASVDFPLTLFIGNHSKVPTQTRIQVEIYTPKGWLPDGDTSLELPQLNSGEVRCITWTLRPGKTTTAGSLCLRVKASRFEGSLTILHGGCREISPSDIQSASISRYPGGRKAAFSLRGDMDLYDVNSFQSIAGLERAFSLSRRYAVPQTMYLSTRLSLDRNAAEEWARHYGVNRGAAEIDSFVDWLRNNVDLCYKASYPVNAKKRFVIELGNHGHLHYDTDTSGAPGNDWRAGAKPGEGNYPWQDNDHSSFGDQKDNIREAARWCRERLNYEPRSWAKPGRGNDRFSPAAVEAAGCTVATGSDISPLDNVLRQPPPHHPSGTKIVELTARYPSDPQHILHHAMLKFWIYRGHRLGIPVVILVHQHMRQFDGIACEKFTENLLHMVVNQFNGDLYLDTVYAVGQYWLDVLSDQTKVVDLKVVNGDIQICNRGNRRIDNVPIDIQLRDGSRLTRLVDLGPEESATVKLQP